MSCSRCELQSHGPAENGRSRTNQPNRICACANHLTELKAHNLTELSHACCLLSKRQWQSRCKRSSAVDCTKPADKLFISLLKRCGRSNRALSMRRPDPFRQPWSVRLATEHKTLPKDTTLNTYLCSTAILLAGTRNTPVSSISAGRDLTA
jgi:hypothetical protein